LLFGAGGEGSGEGCLIIPCYVRGCKSRDPAEGGTGTAFLLADYINIDYQMAESPQGGTKIS